MQDSLTKITSKWDLDIMIRLLCLEYKDIESRSFKNIANLITEIFKVDCKESDISNYYEDDLVFPIEDYELESRKVEFNINNL